MYRYLLFDLDGTLTDPKEGITRSVQYALEALGQPEPDPEKLVKFIGPPLLEQFMEHCGIGREQADEWETPVGTLRFITRYSDAGNTWFLTGHPVSTAEDLKTLQWIYEHVKIRPDGGADSAHAETGERGLYVPLIGCEMKTCFQSMVERWIGTENLVYLLADEPEIPVFAKKQKSTKAFRAASSRVQPAPKFDESAAIPVKTGKDIRQGVLVLINVLKFIHHDIFQASLPFFPGNFVLLQNVECKVDQIIKIKTITLSLLIEIAV